MRRVTFEVTTATPLPVGEQVFVTGNCEALGDWKPDGFPLSRIKDNYWVGSVVLPAGTRIEYKITRGSWETESMDDQKNVPPNGVIDIKGEHTVTTCVYFWKDTVSTPRPNIQGLYQFHENFPSEYLRWSRHVIVWLPPSYEKYTEHYYPVLYVHDGQLAFDQGTMEASDNLRLDESCLELIHEGKMQEIIVVAINSSSDSVLEYDPSLAGKEYIRFITEELKPFIDRNYRTLPGREHTAIAGCSLASTLSFYLAWSKPEFCFGAACLSPALRCKENELLFDAVRKTKNTPQLKLFLYAGNGDTVEKELSPDLKEMADLLIKKGLKPGDNLHVTYDPHGEHSGRYWRQHTQNWLTIFFGKPVHKHK